VARALAVPVSLDVTVVTPASVAAP